MCALVMVNCKFRIVDALSGVPVMAVERLPRSSGLGVSKRCPRARDERYRKKGM